MKTVQWVLIGCRVLSVCLSLSLTLMNSGCSDQGAAPGGATSEEEAKRNADTRKAMEEASKAAHKQ